MSAGAAGGLNHALVTGPAAEPVTTSEAKLHLREDGTAQDTVVAALVTAAREAVEQRLGRALISQTWRLKMDAFPASSLEAIRLPLAPLASVSSIAYVDGAGATQTWASSNYVVSTGTLPGEVRLAYDAASWPVTRDQPEAVTVTYVAGYGASASAVPGPIKQAILLLVGHYYENRESVVTGTIASDLPQTVEWLLAPYRNPFGWVAG